jgi:hypothetical protein
MTEGNKGPVRTMWRFLSAPDAAPGLYHVVLAGLTLSFVLMPVAELIPFGTLFVRATMLLILLAAIAAVSDRPLLLVLGILLALPSMFARPIDAVGYEAVVVADLAVIGVFIFVILVFLARILSHRVVTPATISGAVAVYLLLGLLWVVVYSLLETMHPCSFNGIPCDPLRDRASEISADVQGALYYYSFVTLTTLGYGDISPATDLSRTAATLQAVVGQLYLVVLVARLVGLVNMQRPGVADTDRGSAEEPATQVPGAGPEDR